MIGEAIGEAGEKIGKAITDRKSKDVKKEAKNEKTREDRFLQR